MVRGVVKTTHREAAVAAAAVHHQGAKAAIVWMPVLESRRAAASCGRKRASERVRRMRMRLVSHSKESYSLLSKKR